MILQILNWSLENLMAAFWDYDVIIAHGPGCWDGATAAWLFWRTLPPAYRHQIQSEGGFYSYSNDVAKSGPFVHPNSQEGAMRLQQKGYNRVFVFAQPQERIAARLISGKRVLVLDLDLGEALISLVEAASFVFVCDHHESTIQTIQKYAHLLLSTYRDKFGMFVNASKQESAASLAWRMLYQDPLPPLIEIVRIGDTWQWNDRPELQARAVLRTLDLNRVFRSFIDIESAFNNWTVNFPIYVQIGTALVQSQKSLIQRAAKRCDLGMIKMNDGTQYTVAYTQATILHSEIGDAIRPFAEARFKVPIDFCATWKYVSKKQLVSVSLRAGCPGLNLASIAQNVAGGSGKGGGHKSAASFTIVGLENFHQFIRPVAIQSSLDDFPEVASFDSD